MTLRGRLPAEIEKFLRHQRVAHLATADRTGRPHVVPICFAISGVVLYTVIDRKPKRTTPFRLRRVRNIESNPRVAAVVDIYAEDWSRLGFVLLEGRARMLRRGATRTKALVLLRRKYSQYRGMDLHNRPVIAVTIQHLVQWGHIDRSR